MFYRCFLAFSASPSEGVFAAETECFLDSIQRAGQRFCEGNFVYVVAPPLSLFDACGSATVVGNVKEEMDEFKEQLEEWKKKRAVKVQSGRKPSAPYRPAWRPGAELAAVESKEEAESKEERKVRFESKDDDAQDGSVRTSFNKDGVRIPTSSEFYLHDVRTARASDPADAMKEYDQYMRQLHERGERRSELA